MARNTQPKSTIKKTTMRIRSVAPGRKQTLSSPPARSDNGTLSLPHDHIAVRAYQIYLERGGGHGCALDDWLQAERELAS